MKLTINDRVYEVSVPGDEPLLWVLRDDLGLTGTKPGCEAGVCGYCTVLVGGRPVPACQTPAGEAVGKGIRTIDGLAATDSGGEERLHPVQQAFLEEQALQCGWCAAGQVLAAVALLDRIPRPSREQVDEAMGAVHCRCGSYPRIRAAVNRAAAGKEERG
ncbi:MAG: (2Fe-2S)-binding protein [Rubrobacteraceae bacterium]